MWEFACRCRPGDTPIVLILLGGGGDALMASLVTVVPQVAWACLDSKVMHAWHAVSMPGQSLTAVSCCGCPLMLK